MPYNINCSVINFSTLFSEKRINIKGVLFELLSDCSNKNNMPIVYKYELFEVSLINNSKQKRFCLTALIISLNFAVIRFIILKAVLLVLAKCLYLKL